MLALLAQGDETAVQWIVKSAQSYVERGASISFEACCNLSPTVGARRRAMRNTYIIEAARALGGGSPVMQTELHDAFQRFLSDHWPSWKDCACTPKCATPAQYAMNLAAKSGRIPSTPQGLGKIVREQLGNGAQ
jgi:hypothetical protein